LYLYIVGVAVALLGPSTFAIQLPSWLFAIACICLVWKLTESINESISFWIPVLTAASSLWLFHYSRSGLRAIAAPFFLGAFALLLDRAERGTEARRNAVCGIVLGLSVYSYTACRVLPIAFIAYAAIRLWTQPQNRKPLIARYREIVAWALVASIPNLIFLVTRPGDFLTRGSYVLVGSSWDKAANVISTAILPFYYPDRYRDLGGHGFLFDSISAALTARGHNPVHIIVAAALVITLSQAGRYFEKPVFAFMLLTWIVSILMLGIAGPSLTRMLIVLPVCLVFAALGFETLLTKVPSARAGVLLVLVWLWLSGDYSYLAGLGETQAASIYFNSAATAIGQQAERSAREGRRVLCVVSRDKDVVAFLTHDQSARVGVVEFYAKPLNPAEIPFNAFQPDDLIVENLPRFNGFTGRFPQAFRIGRDDRFNDVRFPPISTRR
jgi:hypothetical protein